MANQSFSEAFDAAVTRRGVTLSWLSQRLKDGGDPVSLTTLSYWRSGQRTPYRETSLEALVRLEDLLRMEPGSLVDALPHRPRPGRDPRRPFGQLVGIDQDLGEMLATVGIDDPFEARSIGGVVMLDVGPDRQVQQVRTTMVWEARVEGVQALPVYLKFDSAPHGEPRLVETHGCVGHRSHFDAATGMFVACLDLGRQLHRGEVVVVEILTVGLAEEVPATDWWVVTERRVAESVVWVRFHPDAVPMRARRTAASTKESWRKPLAITAHSISNVVRGFGPGTFGVEWDWE